MFNRISTLLVILLRAFLLGRFLLNNSAYAIPIALSEAFALFSTLRGMEKEICSDRSFFASIVPFLYLSPLLFGHKAYESVFPFSVIWLVGLGVVQLGFRLYMGFHVTVGLPMFRGLLSQGPYAFVRHPLAATEILIAILFPLAFPSEWNVAWAFICVLGFVVAVFIEEDFLSRFPAYRVYRRHVRYYFIPGLL